MMSDSGMRTPVSLNTAISVGESEPASLAVGSAILRPVTKTYIPVSTAHHHEQGASSPLNPSVGTESGMGYSPLPCGDELASSRGSYHLRQQPSTTVVSRRSLVIAGLVSTGVLLLGAGAIVAWSRLSSDRVSVSDTVPADQAQLGNEELTASCANAPCVNGGICHNITLNANASFFCECTPHFTGNLCESAVMGTISSTVLPNADNDTTTASHQSFLVAT